jgi:prepilin-type N-terminal cleavage/methylation domain-containing protein
MKDSGRGYSLFELITVLAIIAIFSLVTLPRFLEVRKRAAIETAAGDVRAVFAFGRSQAIARGRNVGIKFLRFGDQWQYAFYEDGNANGIRNAEIVNGTDPLLRPYQTVLRGTGTGRIGLPKGPVPDPTGSGLIAASASPIRFNSSTICSFSPVGSATSGSVFLTDGSDTAGVVIVSGPTARVRLMMFNGGQWRKR